MLHDPDGTANVQKPWADGQHRQHMSRDHGPTHLTPAQQTKQKWASSAKASVPCAAG